MGFLKDQAAKAEQRRHDRLDSMKAKGGVFGRALEAKELERTFGVRVGDGQVESTKTGEVVALPASASVEEAGQLEKRVTVTRFLATGPFAFALRKKVDRRQLFLVVEGGGTGFVLEVPADKQLQARQLAQTISLAGR